jgi:hypothetical protein
MDGLSERCGAFSVAVGEGDIQERVPENIYRIKGHGQPAEGI